MGTTGVRESKRKNGLRFCPNCKRVFERAKMGKAMKPIFHANMSSFGLERESCGECA